MKFFRYLLLFAIAIFIFGSNSADAQSFSGNQTREIERKVYKKIATLPYYGLFDHISFQVSGDTVYLKGDVVRPSTRKDAERSVKRIPGVANVVNNIEVLPLSGFDDQIRRQLVRNLANGGSLYRYLQGANPSMRLIVDNGHVSLEGIVATRGDANLANILASQVFGVFSVKNNLIIEKERIQ